jgi:radical SAM PhpK family P-methyltransferase
MRECDCLLIGNNDINFGDYVNMVRAMGEDHADYKDLNLNFIQYNNKPYRPLDILTHFYYENKQGPHRPFHNSDLLWIVVSYLGTYLAKRGFSFDYINLFHLQKERLREKLEETDFLTAVITTTNYTFDLPILEIISFIRKYNDTVKIIVGGPYISKRYERMDVENLKSFFKHLDADFYIYSREGEQTLVNLLNALKHNNHFHQVNNIAYKKGNGYLVTPSLSEVNSLEENMSDYSLFHREDIGGFVNLRISEGCPYACSFCAYPTRANQNYKYMNVEHIMKKLDAVRDIGGVTNLFFVDGTLNVPLEKFKDMLRMMIRQKYGFKWHCFFRCDNYDEETIELMRESGCQGVYLGLESANDTLLKNMNKTAGKENYLKAIPLFKKAGILVMVSIFVGFPGETVHTFQETLDFLEVTQPDFYRPQLWFCEPQTLIWHQREKYGLKGYHFAWSHKTMDAKTACDLLEKAFFSIDTPIWVPDPGFNFVSLYYLEQKGMSIQRQKRFLRCFNAVVKEKLLYPHKKEISPDLLESLKRSCRFHQPDEPDMRPVEMFSSPGYTAAETFWVKEFGNQPSSSAPEKGRDPHQVIGTGGTRSLEKSLVEHLELAYKGDLSYVILAAYSALLLRLHGHEDTAIITAVDDKGALPLRLYPSWTLRFREFLHTTRQKVSQAMEHRLYALYILTNPLRMKTYGGGCPTFEMAYLVTHREDTGLQERLTAYPILYQGISLILRVIKNDNGVKIRFRYAAGKYSPDTIETLSRYLISILKGISENPDILLKEIVLEAEKEKHNVVMKTHASEDFNF